VYPRPIAANHSNAGSITSVEHGQQVGVGSDEVGARLDGALMRLLKAMAAFFIGMRLGLCGFAS
jgi:hypothetical protein